ncbi:MAG TPA: hypothetical protein VGG57_19800 [Stellaceae bacterium]
MPSDSTMPRLDRPDRESLSADLATRSVSAGWLITACGCVAFGLAAAIIPKSAAWDLRNYHYYIPYSFLNDRANTDAFAAHIQTYLNPLPELPFYWLNGLLPGRKLAFLLGAIQGLNFGLLYLLVRRVMPTSIFTAIGLAAIGVCGACSLSEIGTTFYDYLSVSGVLASLLLMTDRRRDAHAGRTILFRSFMAGLPLGLAAGAKLTAAIYAPAFVVAVFLVRGRGRRGVVDAVAAAGGVALGTLLLGGYWMAHLWTTTGDPVFPFFGGLFPGSAAAGAPSHDVSFLPRTLEEWLLYPLGMTLVPRRVAEMEWRDYRFLLMYVLAVIPLLEPIRRWRAGGDHLGGTDPRLFDTLSIFAGLSYLTWLCTFAIWRYAQPLETLAPLLIALWVRALPLDKRTGNAVLTVLLLAVAITVRPADWGRVAWGPWRESFVSARVPPVVPADALVLLAGPQPTAYLAPFFPPTTHFVRISSDRLSTPFLRLPAMQDRIGALLARDWKGSFVLIAPKKEEDQEAQIRSILRDLAAVGFRAKLDACAAISTSLAIDGEPQLCPLVRIGV